MSLRVYNTLTGKKEPFEPVRPGQVGIYLCGPTVYKPPHIGHMVGPVIFDAIKRYLTFKGFKVTLVVNITDVEDKLIAAATEEGTTVQEVADRCTKAYMDVLTMLGIDTIDHFPKASEHMPEIIAITQKLVDRGFAYVADGNVWFDVTADKDYGKLSNRRVEDQESGLRELEGSGKKHPADFGLWKSAKPGEPSWDSPWGKGRPGWHIECSAMSSKLLGDSFDMHGGGMDLLFPHHENELAQSESASGKPLARFWMHNGLTKMRTKLKSGEVKSEKMSKSIGNTVDAKALVEKHGAELIRYMLLSTHYRRPIDFSEEVLAAARKGMGTFERLFERVARIGVASGASGAGDAPFKNRFLEMMDDDFNTAGAIGVLHDLAGEINSYIEGKKVERDKNPADIQHVMESVQALRFLGNLLGLFRRSSQVAAASVPMASDADQLMQLIIQLRAMAREKKDFAMSDAIRDGLKKLGIALEDRADGTGWRRD